MRQGDLSPVVATLVEAADPEKVSAAALAAYALEASQAPAAREIALVASLAPTPLDQPEVVGVVGVLLADDLFPSEMRIKGSDAAYVTNLAVASRARRRGIANDLLHSAERFASESGRSTVWCRVDDDNDVARGFYKRRGYAPREPPRLVKYRDVLSSAYGFAGLAHFIDLVFLNSTVAVYAGAPAFWEMTGLEKTLALVWCAVGPLATAANFWAKKKNAPSVAVAGLVAYGAFETALACVCALLFGARGGGRRHGRGRRAGGRARVLPGAGAGGAGGENKPRENRRAERRALLLVVSRVSGRRVAVGSHRRHRRYERREECDDAIGRDPVAHAGRRARGGRMGRGPPRAFSDSKRRFLRRPRGLRARLERSRRVRGARLLLRRRAAERRR
jgi:ribosomal protein S18 acetylase RimI-like enzyme